MAGRRPRRHPRVIQDEDDQALRLNPKFTAGYVERGNAYQFKGDFERAVQNYDQAIKLDPKYAAAFTERGNTYAARGNIDRALQDYEQAIKFNPNYAGVFNSRAMLFRRKGDRKSNDPRSGLPGHQPGRPCPDGDCC